MAIGDGLSDPINQMGYSNFLYETGLIDENDKPKIEAIAKEARREIIRKNWRKASDVSKLTNMKC